ncbi:hypothetical protein GALL_475040 [mine drainage metagenome]|uniref:Uncharacterized protein n=1 Tax=mine drainage metagenome TaxID=410659 RepID=A0A1J5PJA0_9ZZZZ
MGDLLQRILNRVGKGVHGVDAPHIAGVVVGGAADAVDGRVAHIDVGAGHVDFGAQHHGTVFMLAVAHFAQDAQVFVGRATTKRTVDAGLAEVTAVHAHLLGCLLVHVSVAGFDQVLRGTVHEVKVVAGLVGGGIFGPIPFKAEPFHRINDRVDVFGVFFFGVGVIKTQVADATIVTREAEIDADALGVTNVQIAIGFGRKAGADFGWIRRCCAVVGSISRAAGPAALGVGAFFEIVFNDLAQEIARFGCAAGCRAMGSRCGVTHGIDFRRVTRLMTQLERWEKR